MCGILFSIGPNAQCKVSQGLERLRHRGPDDMRTWQDHQAVFGFNRLAINGAGSSGQQPTHDGETITAVNGEIYNYRTLALQYGLLPIDCDTQVLAPLYQRFGPACIQQLDGFYAAIIYSSRTGEIICLRDHIGKKPLFVGRSGEDVFITSELKAVERIDHFEALPLGVSRVDPETGDVQLLASHTAASPSSEPLEELLEQAVVKRLPAASQPVGVFLSGGLDSSLVATITAQHRPDAHFFTLGEHESVDAQSAAQVVKALRLQRVHAVPLPSKEQLPSLIRSVVQCTESYNPSIISNGLATYLLAAAARRAGIKVVLTGEGADELFCGYHTFSASDPWRETRRQLIADLPTTELRRLDLASMAHSVEARCPFLDRSVRTFSDRLGYEALFAADGMNKLALRSVFTHLLPASIRHRPKVSFDVGSGIRGQVVRHLTEQGTTEREALHTIWREHYPYAPEHAYFEQYPVFDHAIDKRGVAHR